MNTHRFIHSRLYTPIFGENRLCFDHEIIEPSHAQEVITADSEIRKNENLSDAIQRYLNAYSFQDATLQNQFDRTMFEAILLGGLMAKDPSLQYGSIPRNDIAVAEAFLSPAEIAALHLDSAVAQRAWENKDEVGIHISLRPIIDASIQKYQRLRKELNGILQEHRIGFSDPSFSGAPALTDRLSRNEYFSLLLMMFQNLESEVETASAMGIDGLRDHLANDVGASLIASGSAIPLSDDRKRAHRILADVTLKHMGTAEALSRFGIFIGPELRSQYRDTVSGKIGTIPAGETAFAWEQDPMKALHFFSEVGFTHTDESKQFVEALDYYFGPRQPPAGPAPAMSVEDVRSVLHLVAQSLMEGQGELSRGAEKRIQLREEVDFSRKVEEAAGNAWEYIKNFKEHPIGSAAMGLLGFIAIRKLWNFVFPGKDEKTARWKTWLGWAFLGGTAITLYQKHTYGSSTLDKGINLFEKKLEDFHLKEKRLSPDQQTLPNYWAKELEITDQQKKNCLFILEDQDAKSTLDWYGTMKRAKDDGQDISKRARTGDLKLPFDVRKYGYVFGEKGKDEIAAVFYETLKTFFENRGSAILNGKIPAYLNRGTQDAHTIGYQYIRSRYLERTFYFTMALAIAEPVHVQIGSSAIDILKDDKVWEEKKDEIKHLIGDELFFNLCVARSIYARETKEVSPCDMKMWTIFMFEADGSGLMKFGDGQAATLFASLHDEANSLANSINHDLGGPSLLPATPPGTPPPAGPAYSSGVPPPLPPAASTGAAPLSGPAPIGGAPPLSGPTPTAGPSPLPGSGPTVGTPPLSGPAPTIGAPPSTVPTI